MEHHLAHLASAFYASPYEEAVAVSVDGFGDFASTAWGFGRGGALSLDGRVYFPHSLGAFYQTITHFLGFHHYGDEYKVMGLAPYGEPTLVDELRQIVRLLPGGTFGLDLGFFRHHRVSTAYQWANQTPQVDGLYSDRLATLLGPPRQPVEELTQHHMDIARSAQAVYEEAFFHLLNALHERYGCDSLVVAGGCGQNSVANGKIYERSPFARAYMPPSPPDAGGAIGAAAYVWHRVNGGERVTIGSSAFLGPSFDERAGCRAAGAEAEALEAAGASVAQAASSEELCGAL